MVGTGLESSRTIGRVCEGSKNRFSSDTTWVCHLASQFKEVLSGVQMDRF